jgi:hypothetical protein
MNPLPVHRSLLRLQRVQLSLLRPQPVQATLRPLCLSRRVNRRKRLFHRNLLFHHRYLVLQLHPTPPPL